MAVTCKRCGIGNINEGEGDSACLFCRDVAPDQLDEFVREYRAKQETPHPFSDRARRSDLTLYPPIPGQVMMLKRVAIQQADERAIECVDDKGNYYRVANMPYIAVSYDKEFDPDTEGRLVREAGAMPRMMPKITSPGRE